MSGQAKVTDMGIIHQATFDHVPAHEPLAANQNNDAQPLFFKAVWELFLDYKVDKWEYGK